MLEAIAYTSVIDAAAMLTGLATGFMYGIGHTYGLKDGISGLKSAWHAMSKVDIRDMFSNDSVLNSKKYNHIFRPYFKNGEVCL
jgi:hypothetical protein